MKWRRWWWWWTNLLFLDFSLFIFISPSVFRDILYNWLINFSSHSRRFFVSSTHCLCPWTKAACKNVKKLFEHWAKTQWLYIDDDLNTQSWSNTRSVCLLDTRSITNTHALDSCMLWFLSRGPPDFPSSTGAATRWHAETGPTAERSDTHTYTIHVNHFFCATQEKKWYTQRQTEIKYQQIWFVYYKKQAREPNCSWEEGIVIYKNATRSL